MNKANEKIIIGLRDTNFDGVQEKDDGTPLAETDYSNWCCAGFMHDTCTTLDTVSDHEPWSNQWHNEQCLYYNPRFHCYVCEKQGIYFYFCFLRHKIYFFMKKS